MGNEPPRSWRDAAVAATGVPGLPLSLIFSPNTYLCYIWMDVSGGA